LLDFFNLMHIVRTTGLSAEALANCKSHIFINRVRTVIIRVRSEWFLKVVTNVQNGREVKKWVVKCTEVT